MRHVAASRATVKKHLGAPRSSSTAICRGGIRKHAPCMESKHFAHFALRHVVLYLYLALPREFHERNMPAAWALGALFGRSRTRYS